MTSAEVCGFIDQHDDRDSTASALVNECKARWEENNRNKKNASKIGDLPYLKFGRDDISVVIAYLEFKPVQVDPNLE
jgi:integrin-linked kinase-associated serine/threonine phosphatase 2C